VSQCYILSLGLFGLHNDSVERHVAGYGLRQ
jgi:hypothetical protein